MKIVQVSAIDSTMNGLLRELNTGILNDGHELICVCSDGPYVKQLRQDGFDVRTIQIDRQISPLKNLKSIYEMYQLFKREKPDIVHVHTPVASVLGRIAAKLANVPTIIYTAHGFYFHENMPSKQYKFYYTIEKLCAKFFTDYLFTQSEEDGKLAINNSFLPPHRITIISNGVDVHGKFNPKNINEDKINSLKKEFAIREEDIVVSFIGRLVQEKGIFDLLEAFNSIKDKNIKLLVIGDAGKSERDQETVKMLQQYNNPNVIFTGYRTDIPELLTLTDIFCLPSYREGMPRSIIEAMAMECAIVATNIRGSREEVDHGKNGYLVELNNPIGLRDCIINLTRESKMMQTFKKNARQKAVSLYDEKKVVQTQLQIFKQLEKESQS